MKVNRSWAPGVASEYVRDHTRPDPLEEPNVRRFYDALAHHMRAKMARTGLSYQDVAKEAGLTTKNSAFRAATENDAYWGLTVANLARVIAWLELEPRDFQPQSARPQDLELTILACHDMTLRDRTVLVEIVRTFIDRTKIPRPGL